MDHLEAVRHAPHAHEHSHYSKEKVMEKVKELEHHHGLHHNRGYKKLKYKPVKLGDDIYCLAFASLIDASSFNPKNPMISKRVTS